MKALEIYRPLRHLALLALASVPMMASAVEMHRLHVYKTLSCGCCALWVEHMKASGFSVEVHDVRDVMPYREKYGVPDEAMSCHTAVIAGYVVEGHVPAADVKRLLSEKPKATGIAVPGMVQGSPGMEQGRAPERYDVVLFGERRLQRVFAKH
ncbi:MAG: DUF411 domain-containing protein [Burkholderiales bacterium]|nr:MAG: DUF411 domain-containing protein [Burkholderiales bacterium]